jgi:dolichyl-phosphate-mannose--protein O-mannosyl transferase
LPNLQRRRQFIIANFVFLACLVVGVVLVFVLSSVAAKFAVAACLLVIMVANIVLRFTYFKRVLSELREERERRPFEEWPQGS